MTRSLDGVGFDLDGTLVDTMVVAASVYAGVIRALGGPDLTVDDITGIWHIGPTPTVLGHFLGRPITPADLKMFHERFDEATRSIEPFDGIATMLRGLRDDGYRLGVYTTATRRAAATMLAAAGLADLVSAVIGADEVAEPKPAADGLRRLADELGTTPERIAYVGDTNIDIQCAHAAGSVGIHAAWGAADAISFARVITAQKPGDVIGVLPGHTAGRTNTRRETTSREFVTEGHRFVGTSEPWVPGQVIVHQEMWTGRVWAARPMIVVEDEPSRLLPWLPHGTRRKVPAPPSDLRSRPRNDSGGLPTEADHRGVIENLSGGAWTYTDHTWDVSTLCILRPGA